MRLFSYFIVIGILLWMPQLSAFAAIADNNNIMLLSYNINSNEILNNYNENKPVQLAVASQLMTAYLVFDAVKNGKLSFYDKVKNSFLISECNDDCTIHDLLLLLLVAANDKAAILLANEISPTMINFVALMNSKAKEIAMHNSYFTYPATSLEKPNYSTLKDVLILLKKIQEEHLQYFNVFTPSCFLLKGNHYCSPISYFMKGIEWSKIVKTPNSSFEAILVFQYNYHTIATILTGLSEKDLLDTAFLFNIMDDNLKKSFYKVVKKQKLNNEKIVFMYDNYIHDQRQEVIFPASHIVLVAKIINYCANNQAYLDHPFVKFYRSVENSLKILFFPLPILKNDQEEVIEAINEINSKDVNIE